MAAPLFSIIIPTYNRSRYLPEAIKSIQQQTIADWEIIVVDDASTDTTPQLLAAISQSDNRIKHTRNDKNSERGFSRNAGIKMAQGKYLCFLDSDDMFLPHHLETFKNYLQQNPSFSGMLFTNSKLLNENTGQVGLKEVPHYASALNKYGYLLHYTPNPARVCVTADVFNKFLFDASIPGLEDLDLWLHIATAFDIVHIEDYTSLYRVHDESYTTGDPARFEKELRNFNSIFNKAELKQVLPAEKTNRLLSMCYYHLSASYEAKGELGNMYKAILKSFFLYPAGYNGRTNKVLAVRFIYNVPILGGIAKGIVAAGK